MRITKKWLREAKFKLRADCEKLSAMDCEQLLSYLEQHYGVRLERSNHQEALRHSLILAIDKAIPYEMVN